MGRKLPTKLKTIRWQVRDIETGGKPLGHKWVKTGETAQKSEVTSKWVIVQLKYIVRRSLSTGRASGSCIWRADDGTRA
jgi:hypothetical protein